MIARGTIAPPLALQHQRRFQEALRDETIVLRCDSDRDLPAIQNRTP
jgi:hypothetical protein